VPLARVTPSTRKNASVLLRSLNKVAWEEHDGRRLATGGLDGALTVFEVGSGLGGKDNVRSDEWAQVKKLVTKLGSETAGGIGLGLGSGIGHGHGHGHGLLNGGSH